MSQEPKARDAELADFRAAVLDKLTYAVGKDPEHAFDQMVQLRRSFIVSVPGVMAERLRRPGERA